MMQNYCKRNSTFLRLHKRYNILHKHYSIIHILETNIYKLFKNQSLNKYVN